MKVDNKKEQIVQVALKRFSHYGFDKTTMSEIATDLNITKANLYYYYPDKNSLVKDVMIFIGEDTLQQQRIITEKYDGNLLATINELLELRAVFLKKYYGLHIHKQVEWIKGQGIAALLEGFYYKDIALMKELFIRAAEQEEMRFDAVDDAATSYIEIIEGLSLIRSVSDMFLGMPNEGNIEEILKSQKKATKFIFKNKIKGEN